MCVLKLMKKGQKELIKYGIVGCVGLVIDMGIYFLLTKVWLVEYSPILLKIVSPIIKFFKATDDPRTTYVAITNVISSSLAVINNFILNSYFTFKVKDHKLRRFASFASIATFGVIISTSLITIFINNLEMNEMVAKAIAIVIVAMMQFLINKYFTFKRDQKKNKI